MTEQVKQHTIKVLEFIKKFQDIDNLTLQEIRERLIEYEGLLIGFVEKVLEDEETQDGTLTTWWLFDRLPKLLWETTDTSLTSINVESAESFVNYMIERK